ncbi:MAG: TaqI-like C-terminal specificity domain-containing protein, partial [Candidatus Helarchaeota archaeon]
AYTLRQYIMDHGYFDAIIHFGELKLFKDAYPNSIIFKYIKTGCPGIQSSKSCKVIEYTKRTGKLQHILKKIYSIYQRFPPKPHIADGISAFSMNQFKSAFMWGLVPPQTQSLIDLVEFNASLNIPTISVSKIGKLPIINLFSSKDLKIFNISRDSVKKVQALNSKFFIFRSNPTRPLTGNYLRLKHICRVGVGMVTGLDEAFELTETDLSTLTPKERQKIIPFVKAKNIRRYYVERPAFFIWLDDIENENELRENYPNFYKKLLPYREKLEQRFEYKNVKWFHHSVSRNLRLFQEVLHNEKLFVPALDRAKISRFAYTNKSYYGGSDCIVIVKHNLFPIREDLRYILAWLNSQFINQWYRIKGPHRGERIQYRQSALEEIPIRLINWDNPKEAKIHNEICAHVDLIIKDAKVESENRQIIDEKLELLLQNLKNI